jgi:hypothetical protein
VSKILTVLPLLFGHEIDASMHQNTCAVHYNGLIVKSTVSLLICKSGSANSDFFFRLEKCGWLCGSANLDLFWLETQKKWLVYQINPPFQVAEPLFCHPQNHF